MGRSPCCSKEGLNKGAWTAIEDKILTDYVMMHGEGKWRKLPRKAGLNRCGKSCRLRWLNYLRPDIKRGNISADEEDLIIRLHKLLGNRWSLIAGRLPGRTDNEIKNYWNTNIVKKRAIVCPKVAKQSTQKKEKSAASQPQLPDNLGSHVIRTKAKRASEVFIVTNPQGGETVDLEEIDDQKLEESHHFGMVDDKFFSDLFSTDFFSFSDQTLNDTNDSIGYPGEQQQELDMGTMISIDHDAMDWFQD